MSEREYRIGRLRLLPHRQLLDGDTPVQLGRKSLELLSVLAEAEGALVTKDELMAAVWSNVAVEENAIQVHMSALRKALGEDAEQLVTVRSLGYRLAVRSLGSRLANHNPVTPHGHRPPPTAVAVLPFANLTGDPELEYLGDSIAEELINCLTHAPGLRVSSRTSCFAFKGHDDARRIAHDLGVGSIVEGSVRKSGETIRITAQLIDAQTGFHLWSENFDRKAGEALALEDELAGAIAATLDSLLEPERKMLLDPPCQTGNDGS